MSKLSHINEKGETKMVDVSKKKDTARVARAVGSIFISENTFEQIEKKNIKKGNIFEVARISGIMAAKNTHNLIPLCHQINLSSIKLNFITNKEKGKIEIKSEVKTTNKTGVEMEALTAVSIASLTLYDMIKSIDKSAIISEIHLTFKDGGKTGTFLNK